MRPPHLTFACELQPGPLHQLFADGSVIAALAELGAGVSLGILDLSEERAEAVRTLNRAGVPVTAWLLLPEAEGYWFCADNGPQAVARYAAFRAWTAEQGLVWTGIGVDIEPPIGDVKALMSGQVLGVVGRMLRRAFDLEALDTAHAIYETLITQMHLDGHRVESYQLPFIVDERTARSRLIQRFLGLLDVSVDHEVLMLYTSFIPSIGPGMLWSYARDAQGIGVGSTGGGVDDFAPLGWPAFARDLRIAGQWRDEVFVFSLEGCVCQGFLERLRDFDWEAPTTIPVRDARRVDLVRRLFQAVLWVCAHPAVVALCAAVLLVLARLRAVRREARR